MNRLLYRKFGGVRSLNLPEKAEEITPAQAIGLAPLLFNGGDEVECKVQALKVLSGMGRIRFKLLRPHVLMAALPYVDWLFEHKPFTHQWLPSYKGYYGPASSFDNLRMKEFHLSELHYRSLVSEGPDDDALNNLVATLYRPAKKGYNRALDPDRDIRQPFNENVVPYHAKIIARWPEAVKQAIFLWYDGCRTVLIDENPMVFKEHSSNSYESQFDTGLYGMIRSLAGERLGPIEKVENMEVHHAMLELGLVKEEEKHMEAEMKKKSNS